MVKGVGYGLAELVGHDRGYGSNRLGDSVDSGRCLFFYTGAAVGTTVEAVGAGALSSPGGVGGWFGKQ